MIPSDIKDTPFVPSPYCNPDVTEHRRVEKLKQLKNNPEFREVGICQRCKGKKFYSHIVDLMHNQIVIQGQSPIRRY